MAADYNDPKNQAKLTHFILEHSPLVQMHIKKLRNAGKIPQHVEDDDLVFEGIHGLMDALHKYEPERGLKFSTYAGHRIQGKMLDHVASLDTGVGKEHRKAAKEFKAKMQPIPTPEPGEAEIPTPVEAPKITEIK